MKYIQLFLLFPSLLEENRAFNKSSPFISFFGHFACVSPCLKPKVSAITAQRICISITSYLNKYPMYNTELTVSFCFVQFQNSFLALFHYIQCTFPPISSYFLNIKGCCIPRNPLDSAMLRDSQIE